MKYIQQKNCKRTNKVIILIILQFPYGKIYNLSIIFIYKHNFSLINKKITYKHITHSFLLNVPLRQFYLK